MDVVFAGIWFSNYASDNSGRNYCLNAHNSVLKKLKTLKEVIFYNDDYNKVNIPTSSIVYCDIPYKNTTPYCKKEVGIFNHDEFYQWVEENKDKFTILISEYKDNIPDNFEIVWELESKQDIRSSNGEKKKTVEVLITPKKNKGE